MCEGAKVVKIIIGHIVLIIGIWLFSFGLIKMAYFSKYVLAHPVFWGLILIFCGICFIKCKCEFKKNKEKEQKQEKEVKKKARKR